jgi:hypothetical protein
MLRTWRKSLGGVSIDMVEEQGGGCQQSRHRWSVGSRAIDAARVYCMVYKTYQMSSEDWQAEECTLELALPDH